MIEGNDTSSSYTPIIQVKGVTNAGHVVLWGLL